MLNPGLIVSIQAPEGDYLDTYVLRQVARSVLGAEPSGLRMNATTAMALLETKTDVPCPIIGLTKVYDHGLVHITPKYEDAQECEQAGCEYVATDGTGRWGYEEMERMVMHEVKVVADVYTARQALKCENLGCYAISTALSGYISPPFAEQFDPPDFDLVRQIKKVCTVPVIAEGRYWNEDQVRRALKLGASNVCIGAAITRPDIITEKFIKIFNERNDHDQES
jgi:N-acylglucosamine-6-phosphate 2-epimerase